MNSRRIKRQHTVSKFYLRGFATGGEQISRVEIPRQHSITQSLSSASVVKDFYSVELSDGSLSDFFERAMSEVEGPASAALKSVEATLMTPRGEHREALASWMALQHMRGEAPRDSQTSISAQMYRLAVGSAGKTALRGHIESSLGHSISDAELDREWTDITKPGGPDLEPDRTLHLRNIVNLWPQMAELLVHSHWQLIRFSRRALVASDTPVSLSVDDQYPDELGVGIFTADMFTIPLTRRLVVNIQPRDRLEQIGLDPTVADVVANGTTAIALAINQQTVGQARKYIYHHPDDTIDRRIEFPHEAETMGGMSYPEQEFPEEGWFAGTPRAAVPRTASRRDGATSSGFSLSDIPWPIPRRKKRP